MRFRGCLSLLLLVAPATRAQQPPQPNHDPMAARLIASDIPNFWRVFDKASIKDAADLYQREYIDVGSPGLHDFLRSRITSGRYLASVVAARPHYYAAIRESTLAVDQSPKIKDEIRASFRRFQELYPDAIFPDIYFLIGAMNSGGTTGPSGLLIGVEINGRDERTPIDELNKWEQAVTGQIANLPQMVAHELMHFQQPRQTGKSTLLMQALREGGADFLGELISGGTINRMQKTFGDAHEKELWAEFRKDMTGTDTSHWMFEGDRAKDRPADMGYYIGSRICDAYYRKAADKKEAVRRILNIGDAEAFLRESGYGESN
jgi:hypothetical protein